MAISATRVLRQIEPDTTAGSPRGLPNQRFVFDHLPCSLPCAQGKPEEAGALLLAAGTTTSGTAFFTHERAGVIKSLRGKQQSPAGAAEPADPAEFSHHRAEFYSALVALEAARVKEGANDDERRPLTPRADAPASPREEPASPRIPVSQPIPILKSSPSKNARPVPNSGGSDEHGSSSDEPWLGAGNSSESPQSVLAWRDRRGGAVSTEHRVKPSLRGSGTRNAHSQAHRVNSSALQAVDDARPLPLLQRILSRVLRKESAADSRHGGSAADLLNLEGSVHGVERRATGSTGIVWADEAPQGTLTSKHDR